MILTSDKFTEVAWGENNMFNAGYKKEALATLGDESAKYQKVYKNTMSDIVNLHEKRVIAVGLIKEIEKFINSLANKPKEFQKILSDIRINRNKFEVDVETLEIKSRNVDKVSGGIAGAGVATGVGVAALGPTAAMAIATTFGTASTGTAIATLSGAAATNAALAWIGGGALAAGGGGVVAGEAILALAGPIGWTIGGLALVGGGLLASSKNKKIACNAEEQTKAVKIEINKLNIIQVKVKSIYSQTTELSQRLNILLKLITRSRIRNYHDFSNDQLEQLKILINGTRALSNKLCEKVN